MDRIVQGAKCETLNIAEYSRRYKASRRGVGEKDLTTITTEDLQKLFVSFSSERTRDLCRTYLDQLFKKAELLGMIKKILALQ